MEPNEVNVIVYEARNLKEGKKSKHKFSVIFGIGGNKFRTAVIHDSTCNPIFNEESTILVDNASNSLSLVVTDKDVILGQVTIPVQSLPSSENRHQSKATLQPHKKCPDPQGELVYECFVKKYRDTNNETINQPTIPRKQSTLKMLKESLKANSPYLLRRRSPANIDNNLLPSNLSRRNSQSLQDISGKACSLQRIGSTNNISEVTDRSRSNTSPFLTTKLPTNTKQPQKDDGLHRLDSGIHEMIPEITLVEPPESDCIGGTEVTIEGMHLGSTVDDIISLTVCGMDCLPSLRYESPSRLSFITSPCSNPGIGDISICFRSGQECTSPTFFKFVGTVANTGNTDNAEKGIKKRLLSRLAISDIKREKKQEQMDFVSSEILEPNKPPPPSPKVKARGSVFNSRPSKDDLKDQVKHLQDENEELKKAQKKMSSYIDNLVSKVMARCPDLLQS